MLTIDDIRSIPLFSTLAETELRRLAQTSADLHLRPGEIAVYEGGDRALQQARRLGAEILVTRSVARIDTATRQVHLDGGDAVKAKSIMLTTGVTWRHLAIAFVHMYLQRDLR